MPLQKLQFRAGINRDSTSYTNEGGWFDGDSGTYDSIQFLLPVGGRLSCSIAFTYFAFQIRPG